MNTVINTTRILLAESIRPCTHLEVNVYYSLGGVNYHTRTNEPRGYYISVTPIKVENRNGYEVVSSVPAHSIKWCAVECSRQSRKNAELACKTGYKDLIDYVLKENELTLA